MAVTVIRDADWMIAWDADRKRHHYLRGGDLAFDDAGTILQVGGRFDGESENDIDGRSRVVLPGFVDLHSHPSTEPAYKGIREEHGVPAMYMSGLYERSLAFNLDPEGQKAGATVAFAELLQSGVTSLVDISGAWPGWLDTLAASGLRAWVAPWYGSARWTMTTGHRLEYDWAEDGGRASFDAARGVMDEADRHSCGRLTGLYSPGVIDACTEDLLKDTVSAAEAEGRGSRLISRRASSSSMRWCSAMVSRRCNGPTRSACWGHAPSWPTRSSSTSTPGSIGRPAATSTSSPNPVPRLPIARRPSPATAKRWRTSAVMSGLA